MTFVLNIFKVFFILLCELIYSIANYVYSILIIISDSNVFTNENITLFARRVYVLLGVFMLFKVSFSLINYIVNPDDFTDKQKGVGKLVPNIMITLILIVFTPRIFAELKDLQHLLTSQHFFEQIILGPSYTKTISDSPGEAMGMTLFGAFYYYPEGSVTAAINGGTSEDAHGNRRYTNSNTAFSSHSEYNAYAGIWDGNAVAHPLLALIAGIILVLVLIQFCFDIAIRTVKFGFLQLIAPIPLMSRIDPKSAKDGMFGKWLKLTTKTYLDLFIRLIALYFALALVGIVMDAHIEINANVTGLDEFMVKAFLILGSLLFAKQLPKMLEDLFGFKLDGGFTLNPMKRLKEVPGANIAAAGAAAVGGAAVGMGVNAYAGARSIYNKAAAGELKATDVLGMFGSTAAGGASALFRSGYSGMKDNKGKPFKAIGKGVKGSVAARNLRDERQIAKDGGIHGTVRRAIVGVNNFSGITSGADRYEKELAAYDSELSQYSSIDKLIEGEILKGKSSRTTTYTYVGNDGQKHKETGNVNVLRQKVESLKSSGASAEDIQEAEYAYNAALKQAKQDYVTYSYMYESNPDKLKNDFLMDSHIADQVRTMIGEMNYTAEQNAQYTGLSDFNILNDYRNDGTVEIINDKGIKERVNVGAAWDLTKGKMFGAKNDVYKDQGYRQAMANKKMDQKK